jgi:hypothetical protein
MSAFPLSLPLLLLAQASDPQVQKLINLLPTEASKFIQSSGRVYSEETIQQRSLRNAKDFERHKIVSSYSFSAIRGKTGVIREIRVVKTVDGKSAKKGRGSMDSIEVTAAAATGSGVDKRALLEQLERYGVRSVATDLGQLLLLFTDTSVLNYEFAFEGRRPGVAGGPALVFSYRQIDGTASATVIKKGGSSVDVPDPNRPKLIGQVWVNERDFRLTQVTLETIVPAANGGGMSRQEMEVDYVWNPSAGCLVPSEARHREFLDGELHVENIYRYAPFRTLDKR